MFQSERIRVCAQQSQHSLDADLGANRAAMDRQAKAYYRFPRRWKAAWSSITEALEIIGIRQ
jgi:hypothetical protein